MAKLEVGPVPVQPAAESATAFLNLPDEQFAASLGMNIAKEIIEPAGLVEKAGELPAPPQKVVTEKKGAPIPHPVAKKVETKAEPETKPEEVVAKPEAVEPEKVEPEKIEPEKTVEEPKLLTKFQVFDDEGELDTADTAQRIKISLKANGKDYEHLSLDKVVQLAQMGFYNQERENQVLAAKQFVAETQRELESRNIEFQQLIGEYTKLFEDPEYFEAARMAYLQHNSPEQRASRAEAALGQRLENDRAQQEQQQVAKFVENDLTPAVSKITTDYGTVSFEELMGRFSILTAPLLVRGQVPASKLPEVRRIVSEDLEPWAKQLHLQRDTDRKAQEVRVQAEQAKTTLAKRQLARTVQPKGSPAQPAPAKPKQYDTAQAWLDDVLGSHTE